ncbi:MAG: hypothetical protein ACM3PT_11385 [Deltaproteobacteria bacterium]
MKSKIKLYLLLLFSFFIGINLLYSSNIDSIQNIKIKHLEWKINDLKDSISYAKFTFHKAQETYEIVKINNNNMVNTERTFLSIISILVGLLALTGIGTFIYNSIYNSRAVKKIRKEKTAEFKKETEDLIANLRVDIKNKFELAQREAMGQINDKYKTKIIDLVKNQIDINIEAILENIKNSDENYSIKQNTKIKLILHEGTDTEGDLEKILQMFKNFNSESSLVKIDKLSSILTEEVFKKINDADVVIIENFDSKFQWKIVESRTQIADIVTLIPKISENTNEELTNAIQNSALMVKFANKILNDKILVYYGPGLFPIDVVDDQKQKRIGFANMPSTLNTNLMSLLSLKYNKIL